MGSAGLRHLHAVFEEEFGALETSRSFWRSVDKAALNSPSITWDISNPRPGRTPFLNRTSRTLCSMVVRVAPYLIRRQAESHCKGGRDEMFPWRKLRWVTPAPSS
jgi:hypothetical protein